MKVIVPAPLSVALAGNIKLVVPMVLVPVTVNVPRSLYEPLPLMLPPSSRFQVAPLSSLMTAPLTTERAAVRGRAEVIQRASRVEGLRVGILKCRGGQCRPCR